MLVFRHVAPEAFARRMTLLDLAGYDTLALGDLVAFVRREPVSLPPRPCW